MTRPDDATLAQNRAAEPTASTWVSANAGSGKTSVLTDRVARLLLGGTDPQKILCLTFTKAAAAEMQNRLFARLGDWAMMDNAGLRARLSGLGVDIDEIDREKLRDARRLFARAVETPGGLKIQTIHAFCDALLRRFPLEASVSPLFEVLDDGAQKRLQSDALDSLATGPLGSRIGDIAEFFIGDDPQKLLSEIVTNRAQMHPTPTDAELRHYFGVPENYSMTDICRSIFPTDPEDDLRALIEIMGTGKSTDIKNAKVAQAALSAESPSERAIQLEKVFLTTGKTSFPYSAKIGSLPTKDIREANPDLMSRIEPLMQRVEDGRKLRLSMIACANTRRLYRFAEAFLDEYTTKKRAGGYLDYDDLILKVRDLLTRSDMADWVLYRLDGGIDHILVDEAQDTSPVQWDVVRALHAEFTSGQGARDTKRTLFVVGDKKQSIFSFQGARPAAFDANRDHFAKMLGDADDVLNSVELQFSFRSAEPILRLVDTTFVGELANGLDKTLTHRAHKDKMPGRVDLWPFLEAPKNPVPAAWFDPVDTPSADDPTKALAAQIAKTIAQMIADQVPLPRSDGIRAVKPDDVLILVQQRQRMFHEVIAALKAEKLPISGADRLDVGAELAVKDILAILKFTTTPEDDLSLASALRSPLLGLSEADLFKLAYGREGYLWTGLRQGDGHPAAKAILSDLRDRADFLRPYDMIERLLTRHNGRRNLIGRLGLEAEDGIDELLVQALIFEQSEAPTISGFLAWMAEKDVEIKRQIDQNAGQIRVMTVHGAKGLEAPIVVLPDTAKRPLTLKSQLIANEGGLVALKGSEDSRAPVLNDVVAAKQVLERQERLRLLYVAMTRAENWLIVCGAGGLSPEPECWHSVVAQGLKDAGAVENEFAIGKGLRLQSDNWPDSGGQSVAKAAAPTPERPVWLDLNAPSPKPLPVVLSPSNLGGAKVLPGETADDVSAMARGTAIHLLLEHLPDLPPAGRHDAATSILARFSGTLELEVIEEVKAEAMAVLTSSDLGFLFGKNSMSEVDISADLASLGHPVDGTIDRLIIEPDRILAVDFKSNVIVTDSADRVPEGLLRQMGAYADALLQIYPDRTVETAICWTKTASILPLPHDLVIEALKNSDTP